MNATKNTCVITGCSAGIGKATAVEMAKRDYRVVMLVRDCDKSRRAFKDVRTSSHSDDIEMIYVDLASQESITRAADAIKKQYKEIDVLINNAGVYSKKHRLSPDGYEMTLAVNYIAPFLLTSLLLPLLKNCERSRIINLTSDLHKFGSIDPNNILPNGKYNALRAYVSSKLLIVIHTQELSQRLQDYGITVNCVHPGLVVTDIYRDYPKWFIAMMNAFIPKAEAGAKPVIYLATKPELKDITGQYYLKTKLKQKSIRPKLKNFSERIWRSTERMISADTVQNSA